MIYNIIQNSLAAYTIYGLGKSAPKTEVSKLVISVRHPSFNRMRPTFRWKSLSTVYVCSPAILHSVEPLELQGNYFYSFEVWGKLWFQGVNCLCSALFPFEVLQQCVTHVTCRYISTWQVPLTNLVLIRVDILHISCVGPSLHAITQQWTLIYLDIFS